jgi:hypothetical protein
MFWTYLRRELRRRVRQAAFIALGLALGIGLVITVTAAAASVKNAQASGLPWESLSHRQVLAELAAGGWVPCGVGDWAVVLRSPEGTVVARVCPFDPAYWAFVDLCRECAGNRWLPWARAGG